MGGKGKINPHVTRFHHDGKVTDVFHIKPVYYEAIDHSWRPMSEVAVHHGNKNIVLKMGWGRMMSQRYFQWLTKRQRLFKGKDLAIEGLILQPAYYEYATDSTFYPDPHAETTTCDGSSRNSNSNWTTCRNATTGSTATANSSTHYISTGLEGSTYNIYPFFCLFDTSAIGDDETISAAVLSVYRGGDNSNNQNLSVSQTSPASNTDITTADFNDRGHLGSEGSSRSSFGNDTTAGYVDLTLNSTGRGWISKTGVSKLGLVGAEDWDNSAPAGNKYTQLRTAEYAGTTNDPKLVVTHAASASGPASLKTWDTIAKASVKTRNGIAIASVAGGLMPGGPFVTFPLVRAFAKAGAGVPQMAALITGWSIFALHRILTWEYPVLGWRFVAIRLVAAAPLPILAGLLAEAAVAVLPVGLGQRP
jgi:hypothetical protein